MLQRTKEGEAFTLLWIFCVGSYRGLYILNWVYRFATGESDQSALFWFILFFYVGSYHGLYILNWVY